LLKELAPDSGQHAAAADGRIVTRIVAMRVRVALRGSAPEWHVVLGILAVRGSGGRRAKSGNERAARAAAEAQERRRRA